MSQPPPAAKEGGGEEEGEKQEEEKKSRRWMLGENGMKKLYFQNWKNLYTVV